MGFSPEKRAFFVAAMGEERVAAMEGRARAWFEACTRATDRIDLDGVRDLDEATRESLRHLGYLD